VFGHSAEISQEILQPRKTARFEGVPEEEEEDVKKDFDDFGKQGTFADGDHEDSSMGSSEFSRDELRKI